MELLYKSDKLSMVFISLVILSCLCIAESKIDVSQCNETLRTIVMKEWSLAYNRMTFLNKSKIGKEVFSRLFEMAPKSRKLVEERTKFKNVSEENFVTFTNSIMTSFDLLVVALYNEEVLQYQFEHYRKYHEGHKIPRDYFNLFLSNVMDVVSEVTNEPVTKDAWWPCGLYMMEGIQAPKTKPKPKPVENPESPDHNEETSKSVTKDEL